ncbi:MAG: LPXTG cell wall anchor domain-containing protein [Acidimicrobiales bacterium]
MIGDRPPRVGAALLPLVAGAYLLMLFNGEGGHPGFLVGGGLLLAIGVGTLLWRKKEDGQPQEPSG